MLQNSSLEKQISILKEEKRGLEGALESSKSIQSEKEKEARTNKMELESAQDSLKIMQTEHKMLSDELTD